MQSASSTTPTMYTLLLYVVLNGKMNVTRLPMADETTCRATAEQLAPVMKPLHHECKAKKTPKAKKAEA